MAIASGQNGTGSGKSAAIGRFGASSLSRLGSLWPPLPSGDDLAKALAVSMAYYLGAEIAFWIGTLSHFFAPLWPPNMILFCALLGTPYRLWWLYIAAAFPAHIAAETGVGMSTLPLLGAFASNVALALVAAAALRQFSDGPPWLDTLAKAWTFILTVAIGAPAVVAASIVTLAWFSGSLVGSQEFAARWGVANILDGIALGPIFVSWFGEGLGWLTRIPPRRLTEATLLGIALAACAYLGFPAAVSDFPVLACIPIPLMLWAAVRFGPRGASAAILMVTIMALALAIEGRAPFAGASADHIVLSLQTFLAVLSAPFLVLAALVKERRRAAARAEQAREELQSIIDNTPACIYVKDIQNRYILANRKARMLLGRDLLGCTTDELFPRETAALLQTVHDSLVSDGVPRTREEEIDLGAGRRHYVMSSFALRDHQEAIYAICVVAADITELKQTQHDLMDLSASVLTAQDEERRRVAREIHDGTLQALTAGILNLSRLIGANPDNDRHIRESIELIKEAHSDLRTLSYVLHPPALDEFGLAPALTSYVAGFSERTGIDVRLHISPKIGRTDPQIEMALFRIVQEGLSNVHRHSGAKIAEILIDQSPSELALSIVDTGHGMPAESSRGGKNPGVHAFGVGVAGMRARLKQLGGRLDIRSDAHGTTVKAVVPQAADKGSAAVAKNG